MARHWISKLFARSTMTRATRVLPVTRPQLVALDERIVPTVFTSTTPINVPLDQTPVVSFGNADPYPATITASGLSGVMKTVTVTLNGLSHTSTKDIDVLLVSPGGQAVKIMSDAGGSGNAVIALDLTFDDNAINGPLQDGFNASGSYQPTDVTDNNGADVFSGFAGAQNLKLNSTFRNTSGNGVWSLRIVDDNAGNAGTITGWSLDIFSRVNTAPVGVADTFTTAEDGGILSVTAANGVLLGTGKDTDAESDALTATLVSGVSNGTLAFNSDGSFDYTPFADFSGADTFTYRADDGFTTGNLTTVTINVTPTDDPPIAIDDTYTAAKSTKLVRPASVGLISNDIHPDGAVRVTLLEDNFESYPLIDYTATSVTNGWVGKTVTTEDWTSALPTGWSTTATKSDKTTQLNPDVTEYRGWRIHNIDSWIAGDNQSRDQFTIGGVGKAGRVLVADGDEFDDAPNGGGDYKFTINTRSIDLRGVLPNSAKLDFDSSFRPESPQLGHVNVSYDGGVTFTELLLLDSGYGGGNGSLSKTNEHIQLNLNNPAGKDSAIIQFDYTSGNSWWWAIDNVSVTGARSVPTGLTATLGTPPTNGTLNLAADGSFNYTPTGTFTGTDSFTYTLSDGITTTAPATVSINVRDTNPNVPVAGADAYRTLINAPISVVSNFGVLANDIDGDGDRLTATIVAAPTKGSVTLNPDGSFLYTPNLNYAGTDTFTYKANDVFADSNTATVTISVVGNDPVITSNGGGATASLSLAENTAPPATLTTVTATDIDFGQTISYSISGGVDAAFFAIDASSGKLTFTKAVNFELPGDLDENNQYQVTVRATDSTTAFDEQAITVTITDVAEAFELLSDGGGTTATRKISEHTRAVTTVQATPASGTTYALIGGVDKNLFAIDSPTGKVTFIAAPDFEIPTDSDQDNKYVIVVQAMNGSNILPQTLTVQVVNVLGEEHAYADSYSTQKANALTVAAPGVLANDDTRITLFSEGFEGIALKPFRTGNYVGKGDGTDFGTEAPGGWSKITQTQSGTPLTEADPPIEYRGWVALDIDSWGTNQTDSKNFTRGGAGSRGTVLVADGDTFSNADGSGLPNKNYAVDFTIAMPTISLTGAADNSAKLEFDSSFRPEALQTGIVSYSLDGGAFTPLLTLDNAYVGSGGGNLAKVNERLSFTIPNVGNSTLDIQFNYKSGNDWWWAIDNVVVTGTRPAAVAGTAVLVGAGPANGTLVGGLKTDGSFTYNPNPTFVGADTFQYKVFDGVGFTPTTTVSIDVLSPRNITWTGAVDGNWDVGTTNNWTSGGATTYKQADIPLFDNTAITKTITLNTTVIPGQSTFDAPGSTYSISGTGKISGTSGVTVVNGTLVLATTNDYTGGTSIAAGSTLQLGAGGATGSVTGTITNNGSLIFNNTGTNTYAGIAGTGSLTQLVGTTILTSAATPSGTTIQNGTLRITDAAGLGTGPLTFTNLANNATFQLYTSGTFANNITLSAPTVARTTNFVTDVNAGVGSTPVYSGKITGGSAFNTFFINLSASSATGGPTFTNPTNDFTAARITLNRGKVGIGANGAFGNVNNLVFLDVTRSGAGQEQTGLHFTVNGINLQNTVQFNDYANINVNGFNATMSGPITGPGGSQTNPYSITGGTQTSGTSTGVLTLSGNNSFIHALQVYADSKLVVGSTTALGTVAGKTTVNAGATLAFNNIGTYANAEPVTLNGIGVLASNVGLGAIQNVTGANIFDGPVTLASDSRIGSTAGSLSLGGAIGGTFALETTGPGAVYFNGVASNTGVTSASGSVLGGTGTLPVTSVAGTVTGATDGTAGKLSTSSLTVTGTVKADITGNTAGDQIAVTGSVDITGSTLALNVPNAITGGTKFTIIDNDTNADAVTGKFANLPNEGDTITAGGQTFAISYVGGDGNDVVLTRQGSAAPLVSGIIVNDGATQRSRLTKIVVNFSAPVDLTQFSAGGAVFLKRIGIPSNNQGVLNTIVDSASGLIVSPASGTGTSITLTFQNISTAGINSASLADGRWELNVVPAGYSASPGNELRRLFGDIDNSGSVDAVDFASFPPFGSTVGSPFDFDNNSDVDGNDFSAFGGRNGYSLT